MKNRIKKFRLLAAIFLVSSNLYGQTNYYTKNEVTSAYASFLLKGKNNNTGLFPYMSDGQIYSCECLSGKKEQKDKKILFKQIAEDKNSYAIAFNFDDLRGMITDTLVYKNNLIYNNRSLLFNFKGNKDYYFINTDLFNCRSIQLKKKIKVKDDYVYIYHLSIAVTDSKCIFELGISPNVGLIFYLYTDGNYNYKCIPKF